MTDREQIIREYQDAYFRLHSVCPFIEKRGSWLAIGAGPFALKCRLSQLPGMTSQLNFLADQKRASND